MRRQSLIGLKTKGSYLWLSHSLYRSFPSDADVLRSCSCHSFVCDFHQHHRLRVHHCRSCNWAVESTISFDRCARSDFVYYSMRFHCLRHHSGRHLHQKLAELSSIRSSTVHVDRSILRPHLEWIRWLVACIVFFFAMLDRFHWYLDVVAFDVRMIEQGHSNRDWSFEWTMSARSVGCFGSRPIHCHHRRLRQCSLVEKRPIDWSMSIDDWSANDDDPSLSSSLGRLSTEKKWLSQSNFSLDPLTLSASILSTTRGRRCIACGIRVVLLCRWVLQISRRNEMCSLGEVQSIVLTVAE